MTIETNTTPLHTAEYHSARYINEDHTIIDMELNHPKHGWIPITINEEEYPLVWAEVVANDVTPFAPPKN